MKDRKKIITISALIVICIVIALIIIFPLIGKDDNNNNEINKNKLCVNMEKSMLKKENFVIIVNYERANGYTYEATSKFKEEYKKLVTIYETDYNTLNEECVKDLMYYDGIHEQLIANPSQAVIGYKKGVFSGLSLDIGSFRKLEELLIEQEVITKKEIKESLTYEKYQKNKNEDEYLLLVVVNEETRKIVSENMKKVFPDIKQDTVNKFSSLGEKIINELKSTTKAEDVYPHVFYFKNGKVIANNNLYSEDEFKEFKKMILTSE